MHNGYSTDAAAFMFSLLRAELCDAPLLLDQPVTQESIHAVFSLSHRHDLAHIICLALTKAGLLGEDGLSQALRKTQKIAIYRYARMQHEYERICRALEQAQIPYIPLKGAVLRDFYPEPWLRTSCDIDILVKKEDLERAAASLAEQLAYTIRGTDDHETSLFSGSGVHLELHFDTIQPRHNVNTCRDVLAGIWQDATLKDGFAYQYVLSDAMLYFYHMAHITKHFNGGGCGVRPFLDTWILNHRVNADREKRAALLQAGGLLQFAQAMERVAEVWFTGAQPDAVSRQVIDYVLRAGTYGNKANEAVIKQAKSGGKARYLISKRVFLPYFALAKSYPILQKHKWLLPLFQIVRWFDLLFKGHLSSGVQELKLNTEVTSEERISTADLLKQLGL